MAIIIPRSRKDGSTAYRVQIVIKQNGEVVHREGETFNKKRVAQIWATKREARLSEPNAIEDIQKAAGDMTVRELIERYEHKVGKIKAWGRSKQAVLESWKKRDEGQVMAGKVTSAWLIDYCIKRSTEEGARAATINQDLSFLRSVFSVAKDVLGVPVGLLPFIEARPTLKNSAWWASPANRFDRLRSKAGYFEANIDNNLRLHDLRHEALSWLAEKNGLEGENWDIPRIQIK